eukprot:CAMPEP_0197262464 /NCGR_PEP_ID=MMETSP1432-20130617/510_1 /TAXON_ID=44447 /ORGANISM="Pseudo-nitzschia delicatissima, Strain UNC1205" /LENGTH=464 /DNA_ID=CAMNT_0042726765 /DNA_START=220 /DNA_END=1614 /DNA_ORIENTATION=-
MRSLEPRSATPDLSTESSRSQDSTSSDKHENMEDNAALMLLALSKIVSKEISADSSCITSTDGVHKKNEALRVEIPSSPDRDIASTAKEPISPHAFAIPKSIEIRNPDWGSSVAAFSTKPIPQEVFAPRSNSYLPLAASPLTPSTLPPSSSQSSFDVFPSTAAATTKRYRTVSLVGDELVPNDRNLSPLLLPLTPPQDLSFAIQNATPPRLLRRHQLDLENEALRRALVGAGATAFSAALASAAIVTPVPEKPRPVLNFPEASLNNVARETLNNIVVAGNNHLVREITEDRKERHFPMNLPPLLFHNRKNNEDKTPRSTRPYNKRSSPVRKMAGKKQQQLAHGPRSKKKTSAKKQQLQRHTGKKFSWKAYPELEEFLITNREEYLSFSARNYTIEQRDYNNRLTSRLLEHAGANGYSNIFASCAFSAVRDRIRSYYKSYVQSFKRRRERQEQQDRLKKLEMNRH